MLHQFTTDISSIPQPQRFTYPFRYTPHPLSVLAAEEVMNYLDHQTHWTQELARGKMFGVLVVHTPQGDIGYLAAFSGILAGESVHPFFVPPVYDLLRPDGFFKPEEEEISRINARIHELENNHECSNLAASIAILQVEAKYSLAEAKEQMAAAKKQRAQLRRSGSLTAEEADRLTRESQHQKAEYKRLERSLNEKIDILLPEYNALIDRIAALKAERRTRSAALQQRLFGEFLLLNARGETRSLVDLFRETTHRIPPAGAGECAAPKLLQYAYRQGYTPLAMAEFWWGASPRTEIRHHGHYYPACRGKCLPILTHMLQGLTVEENPLLREMQDAGREPETVYEDEWLVVVNKPAGMLSVPGKEQALSVYDLMRSRYPEADGPLIVHRLDMATSGLLIIAKTQQVHKHLQAQFAARKVKKRYVALLDGIVPQDRGTITLPLCPDPLDRPRQLVSAEHGRPATTDYEVLQRSEHCTRIAFYPLTGRTHQLRVHAAHPQGLGCPITGDELYGIKADTDGALLPSAPTCTEGCGEAKAGRMYLHAESVEFRHPVTGEMMKLTKEADF